MGEAYRSVGCDVNDGGLNSNSSSSVCIYVFQLVFLSAD